MIVPLAALLVAISGLDKCGGINKHDEKTGRTALHMAAIKLDLGCIENLLKRGANANAQTFEVMTPFSGRVFCTICFKMAKFISIIESLKMI